MSVHLNMPFDDYNADPCDEPSLRSSLIKIAAANSMLHAWHQSPRLNPNYQSKRRDIFDLGTAAHEMVVGGEDSIAVCVDDDGQPFMDWRKKAAQQAKAQAYEEGKIPLLEHQFRQLTGVRDALFEQLKGRKLDLFSNGHPEVSLIWQEDVWFRCRPDWMPTIDEPTVAYDYKTCGMSCSPASLSRHAFNSGWDIQAALVARGLQQCFGVKNPMVVYVAQEINPPYQATLVEFSPFAIATAEQVIDRVAKEWRKCLDSGEWPGYPTKIVTLDPPAYYVSQVEGGNEDGQVQE